MALDVMRSDLAHAFDGMARARLDEASAQLADRLARAFLADLPAADIDQIEPAQLYAQVLGLLDFLRQRPPGTVKVRAFTPDGGGDSWASPHPVIEIVNDDMPFLVDSVSMELARQGIVVLRLVHPVLAVRRDAEGRLRDLRPVNGDGFPAESVMHIRVDRCDDPAALAVRLEGVLADVRAAVADWQPMRARLEELAAGLGDRDEAGEAAAFLRWLHADNFTFLGYRRFGLGAGEAVAVGEDMGILTRPDSRVFDDALPLSEMPPDVQDFLREPTPLLITKSARHATVHRPVRMDVIGVKELDASGQVVRLHAFLGLFTSAAYTLNPGVIPVLRRKVARVRRRAGFPTGGHDDKALLNILETFPRDELFQIPEDDLFFVTLGIMELADRPRPALFVRRDRFDRFVSCLVYLPRDRYDTPLRQTVTGILERAFQARLDTYYTQVTDAPLARLHIILQCASGGAPRVDERDVERLIGEAARSWDERLQEQLVRAHGETHGLVLARRYAGAFPVGYRQDHDAAPAVADVGRIEAVLAGCDIALNLTRPAELAPRQARLKLARKGGPVPLTDILPMLEAMGVRVISEVPHEISLADGGPLVWLHDFQMESADGAAIDLTERGAAFETTLAKVWDGGAESDGFNRLVLAAGLEWREVGVMRAYARYLHQIGIAFGEAYIARALWANGEAAAALFRLFEARFDPATEADEGQALAAVTAALDNVQAADDDRILRRYLNLIQATLRTNYYQRRADGGAKPYLSLKLESRAVTDLPLPRPAVEIFVISPRVEAIHLRGGKVARGGIRWSDRAEDFRTEILGLMKAQMVKNAVIVPTGAKGGFVVKRPPADRAALAAEGLECYRTMMRGLLDLTDNRVGDGITPPPDVLRKDGDDPYLVVAADKGTAKFSDVANAISAEYGFWLGDAFASGGSRGYDHKAMGITALGSWVAVTRHFRELGKDIQAEDFTAIGVGDMSGDVFGNAMLLSPHIRLVGAFNHSHVFLDPAPDPASSFAERKRLFAAGQAWEGYDRAILSEGGGIFPRSAKTIPVSSQAASALGIQPGAVAPDALIRALLAAPVELLYFGGIGTYVKADDETDAEVGDHANDALRVRAGRVRALVIGEGANLAVTQRGRIEAALRGVRLNTDAIDNSAGVDTSDHEVNIKILLDGVVAGGGLTERQRDHLLSQMTPEVAGLVLRDNYLQTQAITLMEAAGADLLDTHANAMRLLEKGGRLDRALEFLPDEETLTARAAARRGLVRPELAVLLSYAKLWLHDELLGSQLPDSPFLAADLARYFPTLLRERFADAIHGHRLRREIVATSVANSMLNRVGVGFIADLIDKTGHGPADVARAYIVARDAFRLREVWDGVQDLDGKVPAAIQTAMLLEANRLLERATTWVLRCVPAPFDLGAAIAELAPGVRALESALPGILPPDLAEAVEHRAQAYLHQGVPETIARRVSNLIILASAVDILRIAGRQGLTTDEAGRFYFGVGSRFGLGWLRATAESMAAQGRWEKLAAAALIEDLYAHQRDMTNAVAAEAPGLAPPEAIAAWTARHQGFVDRCAAMVDEIKAAPKVDLAMLSVVSRRMRVLAETAQAPGE